MRVGSVVVLPEVQGADDDAGGGVGTVLVGEWLAAAEAVPGHGQALLHPLHLLISKLGSHLLHRENMSRKVVYSNQHLRRNL